MFETSFTDRRFRYRLLGSDLGQQFLDELVRPILNLRPQPYGEQVNGHRGPLPPSPRYRLPFLRLLLENPTRAASCPIPGSPDRGRPGTGALGVAKGADVTTAFTIGYGGRTPDEFVKLLTANGVRTVVDVRLRPDRATMGSYASAKDANKGITGLLAKAGVGYLSLPELGNLFLDYGDWRTRYAGHLEKCGPLLFDRLNADVACPVCLLCAEKRAAECHRRQIAECLARTRGWAFTHIE